MPTYYQCGLSYKTTGPKGKSVKVTEEILVDAVSYGEAEKRMYKLIEERPDVQEWRIKKISPARISEVFEFSDGDFFFKLKVEYLTFDEKTQKEKRVAYMMVVNAPDPREAIQRLKEKLGKVQDYEIVSSVKTKIVEVLDYEAPEPPQFIKE